MFNIYQLFHDYNITYVSVGEHRHANDGWINLDCPYHESNYHLGYNLDGQYFHCWKCGGKNTEDIISKLLNVSLFRAKEIINEYTTFKVHKNIVKKKLNKLPFSLPSNVIPLNESHKRYLKKRNYDPGKLEKLWGIKGTGNYSTLKTENSEINYKHRIVIPIFWNGEIVSFQTRDRTGKSNLKYISCPKEREKIYHKSILYGNQDKWDSEKGIIGEGVFDVWRIGELGCCTFGTSFTPEQIRIINHYFKKVFILFDPEPQAQKKARILASELNLRGTVAKIIKLKTDPADMDQKECNFLIKSL